jgi:NitT/TauT family transport system substrate-binding protein
MLTRRLMMLAAALACAAPGAAAAQEKIAVAIGQRTVWDSMIVPIGDAEGIFKKHGIELSITFTAGGAETLQALITGSVDYALTNGVEGVLSAYAKGAPVRIVSSQSRGAGDIFWYVKADSPIKTLTRTPMARRWRFRGPARQPTSSPSSLRPRRARSPSWCRPAACRRRARR